MDTAAHPTAHRTVKLNDAGALIAAIPSLMGFHPVDSLVVLAIKSSGLIGLTTRSDLGPPPLHAALVGRLVRPVQQVEAVAAVPVVVCAEAKPEHKDLALRTVAALEGVGLSIVHALWTPSTAGGVPWHCFLHDDCAGQVPEQSATELAAVMTYAGAVTYGSRNDLVRMLEPVDTQRMIRLSGLLDAAIRCDETPAAEHLATMSAAVTAGTLPATDEELVRLAMALADYRVRDACLAFVLDRQLSVAAEKLWLELARCLPPPERAEAAVLLAASRYMHGDGAMANVALEHAQVALPVHNLAGLMRAALDFGLPRDQIRQVLVDAAADARIEIEEETQMPG